MRGGSATRQVAQQTATGMIVYCGADPVTSRVAGRVADQLRARGVATVVRDAGSAPSELTGVDVVVVCAPAGVHGDGRGLPRWVTGNAGTLRSLPSALVVAGDSLAVAADGEPGSGPTLDLLGARGSGADVPGWVGEWSPALVAHPTDWKAVDRVAHRCAELL